MQTSQPNSDEIDLLHLLAKLTRFLVQNWLIIVLSIGSCLTLSWLSYRRAPQVFASEMIVQSGFLSESYAAQVVRGLQKQIGDDSAVASKLNLTKAEASLLRNISVASPFSEKVSMAEDNRIVFLLTVEISDPRVLPRLQDGLISFFKDLEFVKSRVAEKKNGYLNLISRIDREIGRLDSLYPNITPEKRFAQKKLWDPEGKSALLFNPSAMSVFMTQQSNDAHEKLAMLHDGMEVIQGFAPSKSPVQPSFSMYIASGFSSGVLLAVLLLGLRSVQWLFKKYPA
jgi:hypothetical protein